MVRHDDPFEEIARDDIPLELNSGCSGHRHAVIVVMNEIADQDRLRVSELHARRLASADATALDVDIVHLLPEEHAVDPNVMQNDAFPIKYAHRMAAMFMNGHATDFNLSRPIRPFAD